MYQGERTTLATAAARCTSAGLELCSRSYRMTSLNTCGYRNGMPVWVREPCHVQVQVHPDGFVNIVHSPQGSGTATTFSIDSNNKFRVYWDGGQFPLVLADQCGISSDSGCTVHHSSCLCNATVSSSALFSQMPTAAMVRDQCHIGSAPPEAYTEGNAYTYTLCTAAACANETGVRAYVLVSSSEIDDSTIFRIEARDS